MIQVFAGKCEEVLPTLPGESVHCVVTSPPYFGLRNYGVEGQIGAEDSPEQYVCRLVEAFRQVRRVLRKNGTVWLNLGDSYAGSSMTGGTGKGTIAGTQQGIRKGSDQRFSQKRETPGMKPKDLIGIPWMVAFALRADGWYLRSDIIWAKPNPMPESVRDRPTRSHEYLFLLTKSERYYYDAEAIKEPLVRPEEGTRKTPARFGGADKHKEAGKQSRLHSGNEYTGTPTGKRNKRSVWNISTKPFSAKSLGIEDVDHFAAFPPDLVRPCILAGCPEGGTVLDPFAGSGTTLAVAVEEDRNGIGIELNPEYVKIALARAAKARGSRVVQALTQEEVDRW